MNEKDFLRIDMDTYKPLREIVFKTMREAILNGDFKPGQRLMEVQLAEQMGVSRTPVREAIRKLELEGLVIMVPRKGAYVAGLSVEDIEEVLEIREVLEGLAANLAAIRASDEEILKLNNIIKLFSLAAKNRDIDSLIKYDIKFHDTIYHASRNKRLLQMINALQEQVQRFRVAYISQFDNGEMLLEEHEKIFEAISNRNGEKARDAAGFHISHSEEFIIKAISEKE